MSILMNDVTLSLKWLTVTLKIGRAYGRGTEWISGVAEGAEMESHLRFGDRFDR